ncbi:TPA: helix-turn-helix domain-containing protein [bacterium]|jgi:transposase|nr:helix-turn-helix domain-containing protein [bacterium]
MQNIKLQLTDKEKEIMDSEITNSKNAEWEQRLKIIKLFNAGYSISEIAIYFSKSENTIRKYIKKFAIGGIEALKSIRLTEYSIVKLELATCIKNDDYPESLKIGKDYQTMFDAKAVKHNLIRVVDETGEDYLYPQDYFRPVYLPIYLAKALTMKNEFKSSKINALASTR